jgi:hypothetical protein
VEWKKAVFDRALLGELLQDLLVLQSLFEECLPSRKTFPSIHILEQIETGKC